jgi:hypothetical protein
LTNAGLSVAVRILACAAGFCLIGACTPDSGNGGASGAGSGASSTATSSTSRTIARADSRNNGARSYKVETDTYTFAYSYPRQAGQIGPLEEILDTRLERAEGKLASVSREAFEEARESAFEYRPYSRTTQWTVLADLPGWLSLVGRTDAYSGGAHGNYGFDALLWDKSTGREREALSLFESRDAMEDAVREEFCRLLNEERQARREGARIDGDSAFGDCSALSDAVVSLASNGRSRFDTIEFLIAPYLAGPYVEGHYEIAVPVSQAVIDAVLPEFRDSFEIAQDPEA